MRHRATATSAKRLIIPGDRVRVDESSIERHGEGSLNQRLHPVDADRHAAADELVEQFVYVGTGDGAQRTIAPSS